jgi:predicted GH43/DUF377 family glycosyl hydrolase
MEWEKRGRIFVPDGEMWWAKHYAFPPTPIFLDGVLRIYLAFCEEGPVGRIGYIDVNPDDPTDILDISEEPVLNIGPDGAFDENGVLPPRVIEVDGDLYMYYVGYQIGDKVPYYQFEGLAISHDGGESFSRYSNVPVIDRSDEGFCHRTSAFVMRDESVFKMWYVAGSDWTTVDGKTLPLYDMRYLESDDGLNWADEGTICFELSNQDEHAFGRPWVMKEDSRYHMIYSVRTRSKGYRLGYAVSADGLNWERRDGDIGIDVSKNGWDSEIIAYGSIVKSNGQTFLLYNGNQRGKTGFGYAVLKEGW